MKGSITSCQDPQARYILNVDPTIIVYNCNSSDIYKTNMMGLRDLTSLYKVKVISIYPLKLHYAYIRVTHSFKPMSRAIHDTFTLNEIKNMKIVFIHVS